MLQFDANGIYCARADVYIDPWQPVPRALITHAHSDHARPGCGSYMCHQDSVALLRLRLGSDIAVSGLAYGTPLVINGVRISFHPAGHIIGSAQIRLEYKGEVWVVSGDYKLQQDGVSVPFEPVRCHHFITESTFGLPVYRFPEPDAVHADIQAWWQQNRTQQLNSVIIGYALGKAQRILQHLDTGTGPVFVHGAIDNVCRTLQQDGHQLRPYTRITPELPRKDIRGGIVIAPPSAAGSPWLQKLAPYSLAVCSGWMQLRGTRRRRAADRGFILSDHCDWQQLNTAVQETGAGKIYVTHGYQAAFARWLREEKGLDAIEVNTLYAAGTPEEENITS